MKKSYGYDRYALAVLAALICLFCAGCSFGSRARLDSSSIAVDQTFARPDPGVVEYIWEPPMVDVVDVPPGLDPEGVYYRPSHQTVVEIRQGRWKYYKRPQN